MPKPVTNSQKKKSNASSSVSKRGKQPEQQPEPSVTKSSSRKGSSSAEKSSTSSRKNAGNGKVGKASPKAPREVVYAKPSTVIAELKEAEAKKILGWRPVPEGTKDDSSFVFGGKKKQNVFLTNNNRNRPIDFRQVGKLMQDILHGDWELNGEPIILGTTGQVLNGQHTLLALIFATDKWNSHGSRYPYWKSPPTIQKVIVKGISESDKVVNTMDTARPRTMKDVIYRSEFFAEIAPKDRKPLSKMLDSAIKLLWFRTGAAENYGVQYRTHAKSLDFLRLHPKVMDMVKFVFAEGGGKKLSYYAPLGYLATMAYLMAVSGTQEEDDGRTAYEKATVPREELLDFDHWATAQKFVVELAQASKKVTAIRDALAAMTEDGGMPTLNERIAVLAKAWDAYVRNKPISEKTVTLEYTQDDEGWQVLNETPIVGGIDIGEPNPDVKEEEDEDAAEPASYEE